MILKPRSVIVNANKIVAAITLMYFGFKLKESTKKCYYILNQYCD